MPDQFSDHMGTAGASSPTLDDQIRAPAGIGHSRLRKMRPSVTLPLSPVFAIGDVARMATFKSADRIFAILVNNDGNSTLTAVDIGVYLAGLAHDGNVVDVNRFASALAINAPGNRVEGFTEDTLLGPDRGNELWRLLGLTEDPFVSYDIALTATAAVATGDELVRLEIDYTSSD